MQIQDVLKGEPENPETIVLRTEAGVLPDGETFRITSGVPLFDVGDTGIFFINRNPENGRPTNDPLVGLDQGFTRFLPDGSAMNVNTNDAPRYRVTPGETIQVEFTYENLGTATESFNVGLYASRSGVITTRDLLLREVPMTLSPDTAYTRTISVTVPDTLLPNTDYAIGVIVDNRNTVNERRERNNASYIHVRTGSGDDPDAYTRWLGTYQGRIDGERVRMKIERKSFGGF